MKDLNRNELIIRRRKKIVRRRFMIFSLLLIIVSIMLLYNLETFDIKEIFVINNEKVTKDDIIKLSAIEKGNNIFYTSFFKAKKNISTNPYIKDVKIKRKLPSFIEIEVNERKEKIYFKKENSYYILDEKVILLNKSESIPELLQFTGLEDKVIYENGGVTFKDDRYIKAIQNFIILDSANISTYKFSSVDIKNLSDLKLYINNMEIRLGTEEELLNKVNIAINIMEKDGISDQKGYIDVSFKGNPVYYLES